MWIRSRTQPDADQASRPPSIAGAGGKDRFTFWPQDSSLVSGPASGPRLRSVAPLSLFTRARIVLPDAEKTGELFGVVTCSARFAGVPGDALSTSIVWF